MTKEYILSTLKELQPTFEKDGINLLGLFGSYSRDEAKTNSDIDILIETTPAFLKMNAGLRGYSKLAQLQELLKEKFQKNIDMVDKTGLIDHNNTYILKKAIYV